MPAEAIWLVSGHREVKWQARQSTEMRTCLKGW